ncbi:MULTISPECIES: hypothetical protein [Mycolicibacterium]|uniref:Cullin, a subunit of E3 ubiquitin ligase n=1 Tax=Mycolicibacterium senegalense TaxID=1796 RepID=A0A378W655_9MYCO|nr:MULTISPECIES: hypothetical protein [Mycolicibacterium]MCV7334359.1 hypothetical protein [Mycolicibacterium senegalense]MDR7288351.1 hypothetical protein [Mycolicibacterium senegalense]QZA25307.1 hypothetical protein K3U95_04185 [Mycolicibacterium senegalense]CDP85694.1 hypothetical protein BN975_02430 [Mycolicibacterium farcinogenes]SUA28074.1 cullin, a subunit of E3 ubiquitin ligase [Mycolicibacterium senegalense]
MSGVLVGSEALATQLVTRNELRRHYQRLFPDVYVRGEPTLRDRTVGAWLWSGRRAVIAGVAASALHGAAYVDADVPIELIWNNTRPPAGLVVRNETLSDDEIKRVVGLPVTTPARTVFDLGRHLSRDEAVARIDALAWTLQVTVDDVTPLIERYPSVRGIRALKAALPLVDRGADSPRETWLRLQLTDAGMPPDETQIMVIEGRGRIVGILDMGWERFKVGVNYDGIFHQSDRKRYVQDQKTLCKLEAMGWIVIRVIAEDNMAEVIARVERALRGRGWRRDCTEGQKSA